MVFIVIVWNLAAMYFFLVLLLSQFRSTAMISFQQKYAHYVSTTWPVSIFITSECKQRKGISLRLKILERARFVYNVILVYGTIGAIFLIARLELLYEVYLKKTFAVVAWYDQARVPYYIC